MEMAVRGEGTKVTQLLPGRNAREHGGPVTALIREAGAGLELSGREKLHGIERCDDLATHDQLLEVVEMAQRFVSEDPRPEVAWQGIGGLPIERQSRIKHGDFLSNARATAPAASRRKSQIPGSKSQMVCGLNPRLGFGF